MRRRTNRIRRTMGERVWQLNYFGNVVRDEPALSAIGQCVLGSPWQWGHDKEKPGTCPPPNVKETAVYCILIWGEGTWGSAFLTGVSRGCRPRCVLRCHCQVGRTLGSQRAADPRLGRRLGDAAVRPKALRGAAPATGDHVPRRARGPTIGLAPRSPVRS
jgi:hypothetical protein